jgi:hypothetical protein
MKQMLEKLATLERHIATEKGDFALFALLLRADAEDKWDLLISAPWLETDKKASLAYVANKIREQLTTQELLSLSRIVLLEKGNPVLEALRGMVQVQHGMGEVSDSIVFGVPIKHAYLITSAQENPGMTAVPQST